ncbi:MAG: hypothetical protein JHC70_07315 [Rhodococcus sp.]|nr:hypothetical protein [Rhodococcus sp. (in: high G+C Gram-positive bacteria)]MBJ7322134.1 hypothetical protein [Rhodococcus sp. (in: high G+C Gram-positive bacteria)]
MPTTTDPKDQATLGPPRGLAVVPLDAELVDDHQLTRPEAERLTEKIQGCLSTLWEDLARAYSGRIWLALDVESWDEWRDQYLAETGLQMPRGDERQIVKTFKRHGMTVREIAATTGLSKSAVGRLTVPDRDKAPKRKPKSTRQELADSRASIALDTPVINMTDAQAADSILWNLQVAAASFTVRFGHRESLEIDPTEAEEILKGLVAIEAELADQQAKLRELLKAATCLK